MSIAKTMPSCPFHTLLSTLIALLLISVTLSRSTPIPSSASLSPQQHPPHDFFTLPQNFTPPVCRFASPTHLPNPAALLTNTTLRTHFIHSLLYWEAQFLQPSPCTHTTGSCCHFTPPQHTTDTDADTLPAYIGLHTPTMLTMDGHRLSIPDGLPLDGGAHMFTAASKESLHVTLLALALSSTPASALASLLIAPNAVSRKKDAVEVAIRQLSIKVNSYDLFNCRFPGFGGFLPWVALADDGITPQPGWETQVPALDNGQLIWAVYGLIEVLESDATLRHIRHIPLNASAYCPNLPHLLTSPNTTLLARYRAVLSRWQTNALTVFYDKNGRFRDVALIHNTTTHEPITPANYYTTTDCNDACYLDDPYEGECFTVFAYLYANWTGWDDRNLLWQRKRAKLQLATLSVPGYGNITTQRGFWFSAHEQWKYLFLPYRDIAINDRVFTLGEKARLLWSHATKIPGLYASINGLAVDNAAEMDYHSDCGIEQLAMVAVTTDFEVTPYGAMNAMLLMHPVQHVTTSKSSRHEETAETAAVESSAQLLLNVQQERHEALAAISHTFAILPTTTTTTTTLPHTPTIPAITTATTTATAASAPNYIGLAWLASSISHPRGQTCFGVTEGTATNGTLISPLHTWDSSITTVVGILNGLVDINRVRLQRDGVYDEFVRVVDREWGRVFEGRLQGDGVEWVLPSAVVPAVVDEWSSCTETSNVCQCDAASKRLEKAGQSEDGSAAVAGRWKGKVHAGKKVSS